MTRADSGIWGGVRRAGRTAQGVRDSWRDAGTQEPESSGWMSWSSIRTWSRTWAGLASRRRVRRGTRWTSADTASTCSPGGVAPGRSVPAS